MSLPAVAMYRFAGTWIEWACPGCGCVLQAKKIPHCSALAHCRQCARPKLLRRPAEKTTRELCMQTWAQTELAMQVPGIEQLTVAAYVGQALHAAHGDVHLALNLVPTDIDPDDSGAVVYYRCVIATLEMIAREEEES